jgi:hypothetical protein
MLVSRWVSTPPTTVTPDSATTAAISAMVVVTAVPSLSNWMGWHTPPDDGQDSEESLRQTPIRSLRPTDRCQDGHLEPGRRIDTRTTRRRQPQKKSQTELEEPTQTMTVPRHQHRDGETREPSTPSSLPLTGRQFTLARTNSSRLEPSSGAARARHNVGADSRPACLASARRSARRVPQSRPRTTRRSSSSHTPRSPGPGTVIRERRADGATYRERARSSHRDRVRSDRRR